MTKEQEKAIMNMEQFAKCMQSMTAVTASEMKEVLNLIREQQAELEKKDLKISMLTGKLLTLQQIAGLALKRGAIEISKKQFNELKETFEIIQEENKMNDSFIFRAR